MKEKVIEGKKIILVLLIIFIIIVAIFAIIKNKNKEEVEEEETVSDYEQQYDLPDTEYKDMEVSDIVMQYLTENDETEVTMQIKNNTENQITDESINIYFINDTSDVLAQMQSYISSVAPGEEYSISVILKGDLTSISQIKIDEAQEDQEQEEEVYE